MNCSTSRQPHRRLTPLLLAVLMLLSGCMAFEYEKLKPLPGPGRDGRLYCYTEDYFEDNSPFSLAGKTIVKSDRSWLLPLPGTFFIGLPLYGLEKCVICPVVDTLLIPYDLYLKARNAYVCAHDGLWITLLDCAGRPVPNIDIQVRFELADNGYDPTGRRVWRVVYDGKPFTYSAPRGRPHVVTDEKGEAYIPIDFNSCTYLFLHFNVHGEKYVVGILGAARYENYYNARHSVKPETVTAHLTRLRNGMSWHIERQSSQWGCNNHYPSTSSAEQLKILFGPRPADDGKKRIFLHLPVAVGESPQTAARMEAMRETPDMTEEPSPK